MEREAIWRLLGDVQAQIRAFDTKAQVALGIDGVLAGFLGGQVLKRAGDVAAATVPVILALGCSLVSFVLLATSFAVALRTVHPQIKLNQPDSHFFFGHLAGKYGRNYEAAAKALIYLSDEQVKQELGSQVSVNSLICSIKARRCGWALQMTALALLFYLLSLFPMFISAYQGEKHRQQNCPKPAIQLTRNSKSGCMGFSV